MFFVSKSILKIFAIFSTTHNLTKSSLHEGLASDFFKYIRENEHLLETEGSPCALFSHQEELALIAFKFKASKVGTL